MPGDNFADAENGEVAPPGDSKWHLWLALLLSLAAGLPYAVATFPQLTDYPSHLARYYVMLEGGRDAVLAAHYRFEWILAGNLGADLLMVPFGNLLGVEPAAHLLGAVIAVLTGVAIVTVEWTLRKRIGVGCVLAFATIWSPAMGMGFYNWCLALALALLAFALWVRLEGWRARWAAFIPVGIIVWLCHVSGWGVLGVLVFGYEWHARRNLSAFLAPWPLFVPFLLFLASTSGSGLDWGPGVIAYKAGIWLKALRDQSMQLDLLTLAVLAGAIVLAAGRRRIDGRLGWAALIFAILTLAVPRHLGGGDFADWRLVAVALMIGCMAIDWRVPGWVLLAAAALVLVRFSVTAAAWHRQSHELEQALTGLDLIPRGATVAGAVAVSTARWGIEPLEHAPSYATVRRDALVNSHFAIPGIHMLGLRERGREFTDPSQRILYAPGEPIDLAGFAPAREADYLWYFGRVLSPRLPAGSEVIHRSSVSILVRLAKAPTPR